MPRLRRKPEQGRIPEQGRRPEQGRKPEQVSGKGGTLLPGQDTFEQARAMLKMKFPVPEVLKLFEMYVDPQTWSEVVEEMKAEIEANEAGDPKEWDRAAENPDLGGFSVHADSVEGASGSLKRQPRVPLQEIIDSSGFSAQADELEGAASSSTAKPRRTRFDAPSSSKAESPEPLPKAPSTPETEPPFSPKDPRSSLDPRRRTPITYEVNFVRALRDSEEGSTTSFKAGDILRIIGHRRRADLYYNVLLLKPPGERGRALRSGVEAAYQGDVDEVGRQVTTEEEKKCFKAAVEWVDD